MFFVAIVAAFTMTAAISDWRTRKLPNWLTVPALLVGFADAYGRQWVCRVGVLSAWLRHGLRLPVGFVVDRRRRWRRRQTHGCACAWMGAGLTLHVLIVSTALAAIATVALLLGGMINRGFGFVRRRYLAAGSSRPSHARFNRPGRAPATAAATAPRDALRGAGGDRDLGGVGHQFGQTAVVKQQGSICRNNLSREQQPMRAIAQAMLTYFSCRVLRPLGGLEK